MNSALDVLTLRELEVAELVAKAYTTAAISRHLFIAHSTVEKHLENIAQKLEIDNVPDRHRRVLITLAVNHWRPCPICGGSGRAP